MGCFGGRNAVQPRPEQTWDAITLKDFQSKSFWNGTAFVYLYFSVLLSIVVYGVDIFTAINLLAFDTWSSSIKPAIPFEIIKWIFSACIILSIVNLAYELIVALRVVKRGNVAECYLDNLAVRLESLRWGSGQGWRRFLVFSALTKSKKGAEYVALFSYFAFQSWFRVIVCSGPRQVVNAVTLYGVYTAKLSPNDLSNVESTLGGFFQKLQLLYRENNQQAVILSGMLFTLLIWVFSVLFLLMAVIAHIFFLWHWIPKGDGGLRGYCERKINKRLMKIVSKKMNKAIMREEQRQKKADAKAAAKGSAAPSIYRQATLPTFMGEGAEDKLPEMPAMTRTNTMATLPQYTSRPVSPSIELNSMNQNKPYPLSRNGTTTTVGSGYASSVHSSRTPLMGSAANMGRSASPVPSLPPLPPASAYGGNYPPQRSQTANSMRQGAPSIMSSRDDYDMNRPPSPTPTIPVLPPLPGQHSMERMGSPAPSLPPMSGYQNMDRTGSPAPSLPPMPGYQGMNRTASPAPSLPPLPQSVPPQMGSQGGFAPPQRSATTDWNMPPNRAPSVAPSMAPSMRSFATAPTTYGGEPVPRYGSPAPTAITTMTEPPRPMPRAVAQLSGRPGPPSRFMPDDQRSMMEGRASPAPSSIYPESEVPAQPRYNAYQPPNRSNTGPMPPRFNGPPQPQRNMTAPMPPRLPQDPYARQGTPGSQSIRSEHPNYQYEDDMEGQRRQQW